MAFSVNMPSPSISEGAFSRKTRVLLGIDCSVAGFEGRVKGNRFSRLPLLSLFLLGRVSAALYIRRSQDGTGINRNNSAG
jgi:hypothetical protein